MEQPEIVPRTAWAQPDRRARAPLRLGVVELAVIHHTAEPVVEHLPGGPERLRALYDLHRRNGWDDVGYNLLVDRDGLAYEGRAGGLQLAVIGAHARGWNDRSTGIALIGDHTSESPTAEALDSLAAVLAWKFALHGLDPTGSTIVGHSDLDSATHCPGDALRDSLPRIREVVAGLLRSS